MNGGSSSIAEREEYPERLEKSREERLAERMHEAGYRLARIPRTPASLERIALSIAAIEKELK